LITGRLAKTDSPEFGVSRGCLLPEHTLLSRDENIEKRIADSMVIVHGGLSQDIGPVLEMVTERYLLRYETEWNARIKGIGLFDKIVDAIKLGDMKELGRLTTEDWEEAIQPIIPWANNAFTEDLIYEMKEEFKEDYWGFLMLGGASGGGMAFIVNPSVRERFKKRITEIMIGLKDKYNYALPFVIDPMVYDFEINHEGNISRLLKGKDAKIPDLIINESHDLTHRKGLKKNDNKELTEEDIRNQYGFDPESHEHLKVLLKKGEISLLKNRLSLNTKIEDVKEGEVFHFEKEPSSNILLQGEGAKGSEFYKLGLDALKNNEVAVVTFAGGVGSRWGEGASMVKAINPFVKINGKFRTFLEIHLSKSKKTEDLYDKAITHVFTTSYLTHNAIEDYLRRLKHQGYNRRIILSPGMRIARRVYPTERDLRFLYEGYPEKKESMDRLIQWVKSHGEGEDYCENKAIMRFNPPGHWYEIPSMIQNGVLAEMLKENPNLKYLLCHNIDTLGANIEPSILGMHIANESYLTFEVIPRRIEDKGGGLARINGHVQLIEGLALPKEEDQYGLSFYNSLTNWINIDMLLEFFGLNRDMIISAKGDSEMHNKIVKAIHGIERKMPTYVTLKNVKQVSDSGQEVIHPVAQFEKLWGDMTSLKDLKVGYAVVSRYRGQQLKDPSHLDKWLRDGSFEYLKKIAWF